MSDREKVINGLQSIKTYLASQAIETTDSFAREGFIESQKDIDDALALLKEQEELLRKMQKDKDKLCLEISEWKHKFHDAPPKFVSQGVVDQIVWERDTALSQLEQIGRGLGSKMDDIVALLKEQEAIEPVKIPWLHSDGSVSEKYRCGSCDLSIFPSYKFCPFCGQAVKWE